MAIYCSILWRITAEPVVCFSPLAVPFILSFKIFKRRSIARPPQAHLICYCDSFLPAAFGSAVPFSQAASILGALGWTGWALQIWWHCCSVLTWTCVTLRAKHALTLHTRHSSIFCASWTQRFQQPSISYTFCPSGLFSVGSYLCTLVPKFWMAVTLVWADCRLLQCGSWSRVLHTAGTRAALDRRQHPWDGRAGC